MRLHRMLTVFAAIILALAATAAQAQDVSPAQQPDIYWGLHGKTGSLCCGHEDCIPTSYRERGGDFEFLTREGVWVALPQRVISFSFIPGDPPNNDSHHAHLCYRPATAEDTSNSYAADHLFGPIWLRCAWIPPGGV